MLLTRHGQPLKYTKTPSLKPIACIQNFMRYSRLLRIFATLLLLTSIASAGSITGVFQGRIVQLPNGKSKAKWLYVQGKNGAIRRANIANAVIEYDDDYPAIKRHKRPAESLDRAIE